MEMVPILKGDKIILSEIQPEINAETWFKVMCDPQMHVWTGNKVPQGIHEIYNLLTNYKYHKEIIAWSIIGKEDKEMIGTYWIVKPQYEEGKLVILNEAQRIARKFGERDTRRKHEN